AFDNDAFAFANKSCPPDLRPIAAPPSRICDYYITIELEMELQGGITIRYGISHIQIRHESILETKEISENFYIDLDSKGNLVSITI
ncbi:MAG: DUF2283 domain-containing protein, partial [Smithella sp.]